VEKIYLILVAHNEIESIEIDLQEWSSFLENTTKEWQILVGEDGSQDGTTSFLDQSKERFRLTRVTEDGQKGFKDALRNCFGLVSSDSWVFCSDTGNKFDVTQAKKLWNIRLSDGVVVGSRRPRTDSTFRRILTYSYTRVIRTLFSVKQVTDADSGLRLYGPKTIGFIRGTEWNFANFVASELTIKLINAGFGYAEVDIKYRGRLGKSRGVPYQKLVRIICGALVDLITLKRSLAQKH
jgi:Glycosyl transferase family 2